MTESKRQEEDRIKIVVRQTGLSRSTVRYYIEVGVVSERLTQEDLAELRRARRLRELDVNRAGVEIILRMRRRILELRKEIEQLERLLDRGRDAT